MAVVKTRKKNAEFVVLVIVVKRKMLPYQIKEIADEMEKLVISSGGTVVAYVQAPIDRPSPAYYVRSGKLAEVQHIVEEHDSPLVIFSIDLSPTQLRNVEKGIGTRVVDRTGLILDIFARHAKTREGKLQVELAQMNYLLPRLSDIWEEFSRLGGGIGTRGPGEKKIEVDRRRIRSKLTKIKKDLENVRAHRARVRQQRKRNNVCVVSLVGYTNAGKSTLLNTLTGADVLAEDKLFATLDPTTRRLYLDNGIQVVFTDTVGFLRELPHTVIEAFKATLEEIHESDLILDVVDMSDACNEDKQRAVDLVLKEIGADGIARLKVLNKSDCIAEQAVRDRYMRKYADGVMISAKNGDGMGSLREKIKILLERNIRHEYTNFKS